MLCDVKTRERQLFYFEYTYIRHSYALLAINKDIVTVSLK